MRDANCIFCKIVNKQLPAKILYEDDDVIVFPDIHPFKPVHLLIVPKLHVSEFQAVEDKILFQKIFHVVQQMIKREGLADKPHRIGINGGGAQDVDHLHIHLMGPMNKTDGM